VTTEVPMGAPRVGAEAEVEMMTVDTAATETAQTTEDDEMEIITEVVAELAHVLGVQIGIRGALEQTAVIVKMLTRDRERIAAIEPRLAEQVEVQSERAHLH
jgi:uncharacterized protein (UPF0264 family)